MALVDFDKVMAEYANVGVDFEFNAVSEEEYNTKIKDAQVQASSLTADQYQDRLSKLEKIIIPFLQKLHETGDKEYIHWPNRKPIIEQQIQKILNLTRG
jgi:hypothetical protein